MQIRTVHYPNQEDYTRGVGRMTAEGWRVQAVTSLLSRAFKVVFLREASSASETGDVGAHLSSSPA